MAADLRDTSPPARFRTAGRGAAGRLEERGERAGTAGQRQERGGLGEQAVAEMEVLRGVTILEVR